jgi:uncharacterized protein (DUF1778 family)
MYVQSVYNLTQVIEMTQTTNHKNQKPKSDRLNLRIAETERHLIERASQLEGISISAFLLREAKAAAEQIVQREQVITVSLETYQRLVTELERPGQIQPALLKRLKRNQRQH